MIIIIHIAYSNKGHGPILGVVLGATVAQGHALIPDPHAEEGLPGTTYAPI